MADASSQNQPSETPGKLRRIPASARPAFLLLVFAAFVFLFQCWRFIDFQIDDAFITYRFGSRLAEEGTLRWNLAPVSPDLPEDMRSLLSRPVEGYTSFLAVLISAGFESVGLHPLLGWKTLGVVVSFFAAFMIYWGARAYCAARSPGALDCGLPLLPAALFLAHPLTALHAMSGMETALYTTLLVTLAALIVRVASEPDPRTVWLACIAPGFLLLGMTRPDGVLWALLAGLSVLIGVPRARRRFVVLVVGLFVLPGAVYFFWRWGYFQSLLPATFYAKSGGDASPLGRLHTYLPSHWQIWQYLRDNWLWIGVVALVLRVFEAFAHRGSRTERHVRPGRVLIGLLGASFACIAYFSTVHMLMGYGWRFLFPFGQVFLLALVVPALVSVYNLEKSSVVLRLAGGLLLLAALFWTVWNVGTHCYGTPGPRGWHGGACAVARSNNAEVIGYRHLGETLQEVAEERVGRRMLLFHHNQGELLYYASWWDSIDPVGLVDLWVVHNGFSRGYVFERKPDLLLLPSRARQRITEYDYYMNKVQVFPDVSKAFYEDLRIGHYAYLGYYAGGTFADEGALHLLMRREVLERHPGLRKWLEDALPLRIHPDFPLGRVDNPLATSEGMR